MNYNEIFNATKNIEVVIHLAAKISVEESVKNPSETFEINVKGTEKILKSCKKNGVKKIIVASSAAVYGEGDQQNKIKEESTLNPISPYGESKIGMEEKIKEFCTENKINYIILRFFNIYGKGQSKEYAGVITKFLEQIKKNEDLKIFGDGLQTRDFVAIDDIINSISNNNQSVWIAQKQGRSKDGIDFTDPAVLKMIHLNARKNTSVSDFFNSISLIPVAISYQKDPNDLLKAKELYLTSINSVYEKEPREDLLSISDGITGDKGNVHLCIGKPSNSNIDALDARAVTSQFHIIHPQVVK